MASCIGHCVVLWVLALFLPSIDCLAEGNCSEKLLRQCKEGFDENSHQVCEEAEQLNTCLLYLNDCDNSKHFELKFIYRALRFKVHKFSCVLGGPAKKKCNESLIQTCLDAFNGNVTPICHEVKILRRCIDHLQGCHVMKHPSYTLSQSILNKNRKCFFLVVNYSRILEVLEKKPESPTPTNATETSYVEQIQTSSSFLPYTFVVVATVCTCLFLIILVVFSVIRHTSLLRRRNSTVERAPSRLNIRPRGSSQRTNRTNSRRSNRHGPRRPTTNVVIEGARQTVSGFFEGNVPPPPYSAVLDETESLRAGDLPPPYNVPQSTFVSIGVIV